MQQHHSSHPRNDGRKNTGITLNPILQRLKTQLLLLLFVFACNAATAQNLVPNPSFENANCPTSYNGWPTQVAMYMQDWYAANCASPDPFTTCSNHNNTKVPNVLFGKRYAHTGDNFMGVGFYGGWYEYIGSRLTQPLQSGKTYNVSFYVSCSYEKKYASDALGIYFSDTAIKCTSGFGGPVLNYTPQIVQQSGVYLTDSLWTKVSGSFVADGGEEYIVFGCFKPWNTSTLFDLGTNKGSQCYYYVDDFVVEEAPAAPDTIVGPKTVCVGDTLIYRADTVTNATKYVWTLPAGWQGTSDADTIVVIAGTGTGQLTVKALVNSSASSACTLNVAATTAPNRPGLITGDTLLCVSVPAKYSISNVSRATSYKWTLPSSWAGSSDSSSISLTPDNTNGTVEVVAENLCGTSPVRELKVNVTQTPVTPQAINGDTTLCAGVNHLYSITHSAGATTYNWELPAGWAGASDSTSILVTPDVNNGTVKVSAINNCGTSTPQTLLIDINDIPAQPSAINGSTTVYTGFAEQYTANKVNGATKYIWTLPADWIGASDSSILDVIIGTGGGTLKVRAENECGQSTEQVLAVTVKGIPQQPDSIAGQDTVCAGTTTTYTAAVVNGAVSYTWTLPTGWAGTSDSNSIVVTVGAAGGQISVTANDSVVSSFPQTLLVTVETIPAQPAAITGETAPCINSTEAYSTLPVSNATFYNWTLPASWNGASTTNQIQAQTGNAGGDIKVAAGNMCGTSVESSLTVSVVTFDKSVTLTNNILTAGVADSYQWVDCDNNLLPIANEKGNSYAPKKSGTYATLLQKGNCTDTSNCVQVVINTTGVADIGNSTFRIYPNPAKEYFTIQMAQGMYFNSISINSLSGVEVYNTTITGTESEINLSTSELTTGFYIIRITAGTSTFYQKLFIE